MRWEAGYLLGLALQSLPEPRKVARDLFAEGFSRQALWYMLALLLVLTSMLRVIGQALFPHPEGMEPMLNLSPLTMGLSGAVFSLLTIWLIARIGRALGGQGTYDQALLTIVWLSALNLFLSVAVVALGLFAPGIALLLIPVGYLALFWILTMFVTELHGFKSPGLVAVGIVVSFVALIFLLAFVMALLGIGPDPVLIGPPQ
ncbi:YIP1 family protein [Aliiroseovarius sp.]|uniref:YIP1 family protein n=1 Tax=Aliiroseovarius sp. TaxID=1872442 RepID=UPI00262E4473|nr:YIP1 family protein [Aliiroseovarius sp.]